jgi:hypothetical protein
MHKMLEENFSLQIFCPMEIAGRFCNTPGVTVVATVHLQCFYSANLIQGKWHFLLLKSDHLKSIRKFEFSNSCVLWTSWLNFQN